MSFSKTKRGSIGEGESDTMTAETIDSLGITVGTFASRIKRKLKEQESQEEESQRAAKQRHARLLQAMTSIRKALQETCKIRLGDRFSLQLEVGDWDGWPRLELYLDDALAPERRDYVLVVTAHDRKALGTVELRNRAGEVVGRAELSNPKEFDRIPTMLKKAVRVFLDQVAEYVLNPIKATDILVRESKALEEDVLHEGAERLKREEVFSDELQCLDENKVKAVEGPTRPIEEVAFQETQTVSRRDSNRADKEEQKPLSINLE